MSFQKDFLETLEKWASIYMVHSLTQFFNYLKQSDLSMLQAYALTFIYYNSPCKISDLGEHMMVSAAATSQLVDRLEKQGMVNRTDKPGDRRVRNIVLSQPGENFVIQSIKARQSWLKDIPPKLSSADQKRVAASLKLLVSLYEEES